MYYHALSACDRGGMVNGTGPRSGATATGRVMESLPNAMFRVLLDSGDEVTAHVSGRERLALVRVLPGDRVSVQLSPLDITRGRIAERLPSTSRT